MKFFDLNQKSVFNPRRTSSNARVEKPLDLRWLLRKIMWFTGVSNTTTKYKKPPIIERALVVHVSIPEEVFQTRSETWKSIVSEDLPHAQTFTEWNIAVTEHKGMPVLDPAKQTMTLRQTFWKKPGEGEKREAGIQLWPDKISFNLLGAVGNPRHFEELEKFAQDWLPKWKTHFGVSEIAGVTLQYVNLLSDATLPDFYEGQELKISGVLKLFQHLAGPLQKLMAPFNFQLNFHGEKESPSRVSVNCIAFNEPKLKTPKPALRLHLTATTFMDIGRRVPLDTCMKETNMLHDLILSEFEAQFTEEAKKSFEPYVIDRSTISS